MCGGGGGAMSKLSGDIVKLTKKEEKPESRELPSLSMDSKVDGKTSSKTTTGIKKPKGQAARSLLMPYTQ